MSQYNKTVLTNAGLELAKRANAGQAKFEITRAVTSADDWSNKTIQDLEEATAIPNIMQQGTIMDAEEVESNNSVIGVSLCFTNKDLSTSYQIRVIGLYVKEEGQDKDFLYAVTTAVSPEYMPGFGDKVLYRFNMQMYLVIGKAQAVNVVINEGTAVTHGQFDKYKGEVSEDLKRIEENHKEDMSHVVKSASVNGGAEILPDGSGKLNLIVPDPDLSKYVSLEQLTETLKTKADITAIPDKTATEEGIKQAKAAAKAADDKAQSALVQLPNKADTSTVNAQIADVKDTAQSNLDKVKSDLNGAINTKANSSDLTALDKKAVKSVGVYPNNLHFDSGSFNYWSGEVKASPDANGYALIDLTDDTSVQAAANQLNAMLTGLNHLQGKQTKYSADANALSETGVYYCSSPAKNFPVSQWGTLVTSNGNGARASQLYFPDDNSAVWFRSLYWDGRVWQDWVRLANIGDVNNAESRLTSLINTKANQSALDATNANITQLQNSKLNFKYISDGYDLLSADGFWGVMEANNAQNLKNLPNGMNNKMWMHVLKFVKDGFGTVTIFDQDNHIWVNNKNGDFWNGWVSYAHQSDVDNLNATKASSADVTALQNKINSQANEIASLKAQLNDAVNQINYIKANYVEGKRFPASQEAQATAWENEKPTRLAMIEK